MSGFGGHSESSRWPPLAKMMMSSEVATQAPKPITPKQKLDRWYVNTLLRGFKLLTFRYQDGQ